MHTLRQRRQKEWWSAAVRHEVREVTENFESYMVSLIAQLPSELAIRRRERKFEKGRRPPR